MGREANTEEGRRRVKGNSRIQVGGGGNGERELLREGGGEYRRRREEGKAAMRMPEKHLVPQGLIYTINYLPLKLYNLFNSIYKCTCKILVNFSFLT